MLRAAGLVLIVASLAGCAWGIERGTPEAVTLTHYGSDLGEATATAQRWCERFNRRAQVSTTDRLDSSGVYFRTTFVCVAV